MVRRMYIPTVLCPPVALQRIWYSERGTRAGAVSAETVGVATLSQQERGRKLPTFYVSTDHVSIT